MPSPPPLRLLAVAAVLVAAAGCDEATPIDPVTPTADVVAYTVLDVSRDADGSISGHSRPADGALAPHAPVHGSQMSASPGDVLTWVIDGSIDGVRGAKFVLPCDLPDPVLQRVDGDYVYRSRVPDGTRCSGPYEVTLVLTGGRTAGVHLHGTADPMGAPTARHHGTGEIKMPP